MNRSCTQTTLADQRSPLRTDRYHGATTFLTPETGESAHGLGFTIVTLIINVFGEWRSDLDRLRCHSVSAAKGGFTRLAAPLILVLLSALPCGVQAFGLPDVMRRAQMLAKTGYVRPAADLPEELRQLMHEQYQNIRFKPEYAHWRGKDLPIELAFFHRGMAFEQAVKINEVSGGSVRQIEYRPEAFDFGANKIDAKKLKNLGFAGFRVHYAINTPKVKDEVLVFLGASYFRALGRGQAYGQSARGLAINTGERSGEEFPRFVEFWIERPLQGAREFTIYALLDSPSATGAYRFTLKPGQETTIDVKARLFPRGRIGKLGVAPLTSMYLFGENQRSTQDDYRPEVHDSDGLSVNVGNGEWIWRPLVNPKRLLITSFATNQLGGFGLQQRDRQFSSYEELSTRHDLRPGVWVEPQGHWGAGRIELVQIPTPDDTNDNIVAYWVPDQAPQPDQPYDLQYRLRWQKETERRPPLMWVSQTRRGADPRHRQENSITLAVDFVGAPPPLRSSASEITAATHVDGNAKLLSSKLERNEVVGAWRLTLIVRRVDISKPVELRANLVRQNKSVSETWNYILPPE